VSECPLHGDHIAARGDQPGGEKVAKVVESVVNAGMFNAVADQFTRAAATIDPETTTMSELATAGDKQRKAWADAEVTAHQLSALVPVLRAAAQLTGLRVDTTEAEIALTVDTTGLHVRRLWECLSHEGRTARWGPLVSLGATIRAHTLDDFEPYRQPKPMGTKEPRPGFYVEFDPEDEEVALEVSA
jgi:hypothetical protein